MPEEFIKVLSIIPNHFNPNVMQDEEYLALKKDMQLHGPKDMDAILVSPFGCFYPDVKDPAQAYVIVDGEHRWKAAKELLWDTIRCEIREVDEEEAKGICYRKNKDRGTIDPFKEAALFKTEIDLKLTQKQIADKFLINQCTVSQRLSLLKLAPEIINQVSKIPRGIITVSHLEPIASLPEGEQKKIKLKNEYGYQEIKSVRDLTEETRRIKAELAEKEEIRKAVLTAKFPKCPKCSKEPGGINGRKLPWVDCSSQQWDHIWNLETGKDPYYDEKVEQKKINGERSEPVRTSVIRSMHTTDELSDIFAERLREMVPKLQRISSFSIRGKLEGVEEFSGDFNGYGTTMSVSVHLKNDYFFFNAEQKEYRSGEKSKVNARSPDYVDRTKLFIESAFQGKLEIPKEERLKGSIPSPEEALAAAEESAEEDINLEVPCLTCANDSENGGNCHRERFIAAPNGGYICKTKKPLSGEELAKISLEV